MILTPFTLENAGFLLAKVVDGHLHINEFDVHPRHGKRGVGVRLLNHVLSIARERSFQAATLTTFEHNRWNAPFYRKLGFAVMAGTSTTGDDAQVAMSVRVLCGRIGPRVNTKARGGIRMQIENTRGFLVAAAAMLAASGAVLAEESPLTVISTSAPEIAFAGNDALRLPKDMYLGEAAGVAVSPVNKHLYVFHRGSTNGPAYGAAAAQLLEFDQSGKYIREIGRGLYAWSYAHNVRVDPEGNIWAVDKGSDMLIKFDPSGRVRMVLGRKVEASDEEAHPLEHPNPPLAPEIGRFRQVTDIAWDSQGNGYISDGYVNSRVAKVGRDGRWLKSWGSYGKAPGQFITLHSIAVDAKDQVYVADRGNRRIQVFDTEGRLLKIIQINIPYPRDSQVLLGDAPKLSENGFDGPVPNTRSPGAPWALCITPAVQGHQVLYVADSYPGRIYKLDMDGRVLGWLGESGKLLKQFGWIHEMACPSENELYVGELLNWRIQRLTLHP